MMENAVKAALQRGGTSWGTMAFEFFTPGLCGVLAAAGADFVFLDMEHSGHQVAVCVRERRRDHAAGAGALL
jgi:2-keto-3-deoxy-L-rhamnonate aldolase RhmA